MAEQAFTIGQRVRVTEAEQRMMRMNELHDDDVSALDAVDWTGVVGSIDEYPYGNPYRVDFPDCHLFFDAYMIEPANPPQAQPDDEEE